MLGAEPRSGGVRCVVSGPRSGDRVSWSRSILDKGWHGLELALTSAARYAGIRIAKVNPACTSQRCSACGFVTDNNRESQAVFRCKSDGCGHSEHADVNAARNIKAAGHTVSACGDLGISQSAE
ncbi:MULTISPECIES: transposase [unclassified Streptomyces]|uniref:transposase n=1 Tax=unclassified Streptomyces TaxID=2593676 RepID=UPI00343B4E23